LASILGLFHSYQSYNLSVFDGNPLAGSTRVRGLSTGDYFS